jgi:hypothetical protein
MADRRVTSDRRTITDCPHLHIANLSSNCQMIEQFAASGSLAFVRAGRICPLGIARQDP